VAVLIAGEFFEQGDMEREKLNITPIVSGMIMQYGTVYRFGNTLMGFVSIGYDE